MQDAYVVEARLDRGPMPGQRLQAVRLAGPQPVIQAEGERLVMQGDFGLIGGLEPTGGSPADTGEPPFESYEPARWAMGDTRRYAERMKLIATQPRLDVASTGYALVDAGSEYLVLEPQGDGRVFTVDLAPGSYTVEWFDVAARETSAADPRTVEQGGAVDFSAPFGSGPAVLYLSRTAG